MRRLRVLAFVAKNIAKFVVYDSIMKNSKTETLAFLFLIIHRYPPNVLWEKRIRSKRKKQRNSRDKYILRGADVALLKSRIFTHGSIFHAYVSIAGLSVR